MEIRVSSQQLDMKADELQQLNEELKNQMDALKSTEATITGMWEGEAKEAFHREFIKDNIQMEKLTITVQQYIIALREISACYMQKEAMNQEIAAARC